MYDPLDPTPASSSVVAYPLTLLDGRKLVNSQSQFDRGHNIAPSVSLSI